MGEKRSGIPSGVMHQLAIIYSWLKATLYPFEYLIFRLVGLIFAALPLEMASDLSGWMWRHMAPLLSRHRRALAHLRMALPEKSEAEREAIARAMWEQLGRTFAEFFHIDELARSDRLVFEDDETWRGRFATAKTWIISAGHFANFEIGAAGLMRVGLEPSDIYRRISNPFVDRLVYKLRAPLYPGGLILKNRVAGRKLFRIAQRGGAVIVVSDLYDPSGLPVPFFGRPAPSTRLPALLARSTGAPLLVGRVVREPGVRFRISVAPIEVPMTPDREADIAVATARIQATFEAWVREYPEQWMWAHRRWGPRVAVQSVPPAPAALRDPRLSGSS